LPVGQPEQPLLEHRVPAVPQRDGQAQVLLLVADAGQPVLAPAVRPGVRLLERERRPRVAVRTVVLPDGAPLPGRQVRTPQPPRRAGGRSGGQPALLGPFDDHPGSLSPLPPSCPPARGRFAGVGDPEAVARMLGRSNARLRTRSAYFDRRPYVEEDACRSSARLRARSAPRTAHPTTASPAVRGRS